MDVDTEGVTAVATVAAGRFETDEMEPAVGYPHPAVMASAIHRASAVGHFKTTARCDAHDQDDRGRVIDFN